MAAKMQYRIREARNPITGETILRPVIANRETLPIRDLVKFARDAGFVRGQQRDLEGLLNGFVEAMQDRAKAGYSINVKDWFRIEGHLRGTVDETRMLSRMRNAYRVAVIPQQELRVGIGEFRWERIGEGPTVRLTLITSPGGQADSIVKGAVFSANGTRIAFDVGREDSATLGWTDGDTARSIAVVPSEVSPGYLRFDWPDALDEVPVGTALTLTLVIHGDVGQPQRVSRKATLAEA